MLSYAEKVALQEEYSALVKANLKKDGIPRKFFDQFGLDRIDEIRKIAKLEHQRQQETHRLEKRERENEYLLSLGFTRGQSAYILNPITRTKEFGVITCADLPDSYGTGGNIGVSFGGCPYMLSPTAVYTN